MALTLQVEEVHECASAWRIGEFSWHPVEELCVVSV